MPKLTDAGEMEIIRNMYFGGKPEVESGLDPKERAERYLASKKNTKNQAK